MFIPFPFARGLIVGLLIGPAALFGFLLVLSRRMRGKLEGRLPTPPVPLEKWNYDMRVASLSGEELDFHSFAGEVVVLNFWATWCAPCIAEMPSLSRLHDATKDARINLACVTREPAETVQKFLAKRPLDVPIYVLSGEPPACFTARAIPATFILDRAGRIALRHFGAAAWDDPSFVSFIRGLAATPYA